MTSLLDAPPYGPREDDQLLRELDALTQHHLLGCPEYRRIWPETRTPTSIADLPFLHVGTFKHVRFLTQAAGIEHGRTLLSSGTTGAVPSRIVLDRKSSTLQTRSAEAILRDFVGGAPRPLLVLDTAHSLRSRSEITARTAAALSLRPLATEIHFLLEDADDPRSLKWKDLRDVLAGHEDFLLYGLTRLVWLAWGTASMPDAVRELVMAKRIVFVHSGGWKRLEELRVDRARFDAALLERAGPASRVVDYYGLVEQVGVVYPLCPAGFRHVPVWADALVRDPNTLEPLVGRAGQLQLLNALAYGAPYHSVLTEDLARIESGPCSCGRSGTRFELLGRLPKTEARGCANV